MLDIEYLLCELNKQLDNKLYEENINKIVDVTDCFTSKFKKLITKNNNIDESNRFYCIIVNDDIDFEQMFEYSDKIILIDKDYYMFYNKEYMELY